MLLQLPLARDLPWRLAIPLRRPVCKAGDCRSILLLVMACSIRPNQLPATPRMCRLICFSTTLNGAVALTWPDNAYESDPDNFQSYRDLQHHLRHRRPCGD